MELVYVELTWRWTSFHSGSGIQRNLLVWMQNCRTLPPSEYIHLQDQPMVWHQWSLCLRTTLIISSQVMWCLCCVMTLYNMWRITVMHHMHFRYERIFEYIYIQKRYKPISEYIRIKEMIRTNIRIYSYKNKLASLEATLVRNSAEWLTHSLTDRGKV